MTNAEMIADNPRCCLPLLLDYACGALDEAQSLVIATYISMNPSVHSFVQVCEKAGGDLLARECGETTVKQDALQAVLARIDGKKEPQIEKPCCKPRTCCEIEVPAPLARYLAFAGHDVPWQPLLTGMHQYRIPVSRGTRSIARLVKLAPAVKVPAHNHRGIEITLVLHGSFHDETGAYKRGDISVADSSIHHAPVADAQTGCVCLTVTDAPLRFAGLLGSLLNPFLRF